MKRCSLALLLLAFAGIAAAQTKCKQASATIAEQNRTFTTYEISLPSRMGSITALAFLPNDRGSAVRGVVFSLSRLASSVSDESVSLGQVAQEVAAHGRAVIVVDRTLTWPLIDESVGKMQGAVLCAEQWLSAHAAIRPDDWYFLGPLSDRPSFEQLRAVGDTHSMTFMWSTSIADASDWKYTEEALRGGSAFLIQDAENFFASTVP